MGGFGRSHRPVSTWRLGSLLSFLGERVPRLVFGEGGWLGGCRAGEHCSMRVGLSGVLVDEDASMARGWLGTVLPAAGVACLMSAPAGC